MTSGCALLVYTPLLTGGTDPAASRPPRVSWTIERIEALASPFSRGQASITRAKPCVCPTGDFVPNCIRFGTASGRGLSCSGCYLGWFESLIGHLR